MNLRIFVLFFCLITAIKSYAISQQDLNLIIRTQGPLGVVRNVVGPNPKILEAGGHYGEDTVVMHRLFPTATIYTFEPYPFAYEKLKHKVKGYDRIFTYPLALYDYEGVVKFFVQLNSGNDGASSILAPSPEYSEAGHTHSWWYIDREIEVPCTTLDAWAKKEGVEEIDFMWLDMEGVELCVLKSGMEILKNVKAIYTEVNFQEFRQEMTQYKDLKEFLIDNGFEQAYFEGDTTFQGNVLFVKKNLLESM